MKNRQFSRIYFLYLAIFFVVISGISVLTVSHLENKFKTYIKDSLETVLFTVEKATQVYIEGRKNYIKAIARSDNVINNSIKLSQSRLLNDDIAKKQALIELRHYMRPILQNNQDLGFFIIATDRVNLASIRDANIGTTNLIEHHYPEHLASAFKGATVLTPPLLSDIKLKNQYGVLVDNSVTMFIITPIIEPNGNINNVIAIRLNPRVHLSKLASLGRIGDTGETYAFDKDARMITESRFTSQLQLTHLQPLYGSDGIKITDPGVNLLEKPPIYPSDHEKPLTQMAQQATQGINGFNLNGYRDYRGVTVLGTWLWMPKLGIGFTTEIDAAEALLPFQHTVKVFVVVMVITFSLCLIMLTVIWRMRRRWQLQTLRLNKALEKKVKIRTNYLEKAKADLKKAMADLKETAATDALTGLSNRRHFDTVFEKEWKRNLRDKKSLSILLFDVDHFKSYNDNYGHLAGDNCLIELAEFLKSADIARRPGDVIARYGGEEFIVLLSDVSVEHAKAVAERICQGINQLNIPHNHRDDGLSHVTVSVGISYCDALYRIYPNMLIDHADKALYQAKRAGRNQITLYQDSHHSKANSPDIHN